MRALTGLTNELRGRVVGSGDVGFGGGGGGQGILLAGGRVRDGEDGEEIEVVSFSMRLN